MQLDRIEGKPDEKVAWGSDVAADHSRLETESAAFDKLVGEFEKTWRNVVKQYAGNAELKPGT